MKYPKISDVAEVQSAYESMRDRGQSHNMAEMLAFRQCPGLQTNATLIASENRRQPYFGLEENQKHSNAIRRTAKRIGAHPNQYIPTLASYPGDPKGFLPHDDPRGHLKKLERERNERLKKPLSGVSDGSDA